MNGIVADVGKFYMVPHLYIAPHVRQHWMPRNGWVPTLGPKHDDTQLGVKQAHFHIDWRFVDEWSFEEAEGYGSRMGRLITSSSGLMRIDEPTQLKRRKCRRISPDFPAQARAPWFAMEQEHGCTKLKPGNICPHRGIDLTPYIKPDGTVICPGHGLRWDTRTGAMLPHHAVGAAA